MLPHFRHSSPHWRPSFMSIIFAYCFIIMSAWISLATCHSYVFVSVSYRKIDNANARNNFIFFNQADVLDFAVVFLVLQHLLVSVLLLKLLFTLRRYTYWQSVRKKNWLAKTSDQISYQAENKNWPNFVSLIETLLNGSSVSYWLDVSLLSYYLRIQLLLTSFVVLFPRINARTILCIPIRSEKFAATRNSYSLFMMHKTFLIMSLV